MADDKSNTSGNNAADASGKSQKRSKKGKEPFNVKLKNWFHLTRLEYTSEFKKIVWPSREELIKQTVTVIVISLLFGLYVSILDGALGFLYSQFSQFASALL
ncbi:MAG: preprotein translocase subunit SecE [Clostridiales bacterium]|jgi:preprotein translocase SecE subunit|nr:preprotein translocase subunit SecE [Clostridiales bacterium]